MGYRKWLTCLCGCVLAVLLCIGSIGCFLTAFRFENFSVGTVTAWCCFITLCWGICYTLGLQMIPMCILALLAGYLWYSGELAMSAEGLLHRISLLYDSVYSCGVIGWSGRDPSEADLTAVICAAAALISWAVCRTACAGHSAWLAVTVSLLPLAAGMGVTDLLPSGLWLWLLLAGEVLVFLPNTLRRQEAAGGTALTALAAVPVLLAVAVLLWVVPRESYRGQTRAETIADSLLQWLPSVQQLEDTVANAISGALETDAVDLSTIGRRNNVRLEIMRLSGTGQGTVYLRGQHMDRYDGRSWYSSGIADTLQWLPEEHLLEDTGMLEINTRYTLPTVYVPYYAREPGERWDGSRLVNGDKQKTYAYTCLQLRPDWKSFQTDLGEVYSSCLQLPGGTRAWAEELLAEIISEDQPVAQKAEAIAGYVRSSAKYDADTPQMPSQDTDFVRWFLEDSDRGYCVHFASSAVVLLRAAGIPARYVTGYMVSLDSNGEAAVCLEDAHAWAEYYASGVGWIVLEATPACEPPIQQLQQSDPAEGTVADAVSVPAQSGATAATIPYQPNTGTEERPVRRDTGWLQTVLYGFLSALTVTGGLWLQRRLRLAARLRRLRQGSTNRRAVALWRETVRLSGLLGQQPPGGLFAVAQRAKFSQYTLTEKDLLPLQKYVTQTREMLGKQPLFRRLLLRIVYAVF